MKRKSKAPQGPQLDLGSSEEELRENVQEFLIREKNDTKLDLEVSQTGSRDGLEEAKLSGSPSLADRLHRQTTLTRSRAAKHPELEELFHAVADHHSLEGATSSSSWSSDTTESAEGCNKEANKRRTAESSSSEEGTYRGTLNKMNRRAFHRMGEVSKDWSAIVPKDYRRRQTIFTEEEALQVFEVRKKEFTSLALTRKFKGRVIDDAFQKKIDAYGNDSPRRGVGAINNQKKFIDYIRDSSYFEKYSMEERLPNEEVDDRKLCLNNKQIGPQQLSKILELVTRRARRTGKKLAHLDLSRNYLGDEGLLMLVKWLHNEQGTHGINFDDGDEDIQSNYSSRRSSIRS